MAVIWIFFLPLHPFLKNNIIMIQELKIKNFLSFKDEVTFSFEATKDKTFEDYQVVEVAKGVRLLRFALVYGANASGKSNLLNVFDFLSSFWFSKAANVDEPTGAIPFKLDKFTPNQPSRFELKFYVESTRYLYILELDSKRVYNEKLYYYKSSQPTMLFTREWQDNQSVIAFNPAATKVSKVAQEEISLKCLANMSLFAARNQVNVAIPEIDAAANWMKSHIMPAIHPMTQMFGYTGKKMTEDAQLKSYLLDFIHRADFNITGVKSDIVKNPITPATMNFLMSRDDIPASEKEILQREQSFDTIETTFEHTVKNDRGVETYYLSDLDQSEGTTRTFGIEAAIYSAMNLGAFLHIDEVEASLHPDLVEFILQKFLATKNRSQLLITTHYDPLLNTVDDLLRRDSVWFTDKCESGATTLYSLVEFKGLKRIASLQRAYRNGIFGALPNIKG